MSERSTILVSVHCPDRPGITAGLMEILTDSGADIYDVEQIVVRGRLTLNLLIGVTGEKGTIRDLLFHGWKNDIHIEFEVVEETPTPQKATSIVTLIGVTVSPEDFGAVASAIAGGGGNIERISRLSRYPVVSYELTVSGGDINDIRASLVTAAADRSIDVAIQRDGLERRAKRLVVMDVDSTLIEDEVINLLAREAGVEERVSALTYRALAGEMDFSKSLEERVSLLKGLDEGAMERVAASITPTKGARTFIRTLKRMGLVTAIVSAGFTRFADALAADLGIDYSLSNTLEVEDGFLTGRLTGELVDSNRKAVFLQAVAETEEIPLGQVVAIGDGPNDLEMLAAAGLGIAFNAKPVVRDAVDTVVSVPFLDAILFIMGIRRDHIEDADAADPDFEPPERIEVPGTPPL